MKIFMTPLSLSFVVLALAGCASVQYDCPLKDEAKAKCASMDDAYSASAKSRGTLSHNQQSVFERDAATPEGTAASARPFFKGEDSGFPEAGERGMPVFKQPEVHRVWVAPYVDGDGNLRTGEYTYFSTPGKWNYGTTKRAGEGAAIFGPAKPGNLGFAPVTPAEKTPAAPPTVTSAQRAAPASNNVDGITQPMQRIAQ